MLQARLTVLSVRWRIMFPRLHHSFALCCKKSTPGPHGTLGLTFVCAVMLFCPPARGQVYETFDSTTPKFRLWISDTRALLSAIPKSEPGVESLEVTVGQGAYTYLLYPIQPCAVIPDLRASMRIRSAQSGLRLGFRIVFPNSTDPATQDPLVEVVLGSPCEGGGSWSTSVVQNVMNEFDKRVRFLRVKYGPDINLRDPYVDAVILSITSLPGTIRLQVDDLEVEGMVEPLLAGLQDVTVGNAIEPPLPSIEEQLRTLQASVPRWIQHQGESLDFLQELGFNAIITSRPSDTLVIEQAMRTGMGVIAPPPDLVPAESLAKDYRHVQGWLLGMALDQTHIEQTRTSVSRLTRFPQSLARPMIGEAMEMYGSYSRLTDWLAVPMTLPTRVRSSQEANVIMQQDLRPMASRSIPLTSIVTQMPSDWIAQKEMAYRSIGTETTNTANYDLLQVRMQIYRSMMQGTRGWVFRSGAPLDSGDVTSIARGHGYAGINNEIELLVPWIRASQSAWRPIATDSGQHTAAVIDTPNSQLALILASGKLDQICCVAPNPERIHVTLPNSGQTRSVFRITNGELEALVPRETPNGLVVAIQRPALVEQIVSVVDPKPVAYLRERLSALTPSFVDSRHKILEQVLEIAQKTLVAQRVPPNDSRWETVRSGQSFHRESIQHLTRGNLPASIRSADQAILVTQSVIRNAWDEGVGQFSAFQSSPLIASPLSLPLHYEFTTLLDGRAWQTIPIPGMPLRDTDQFYTAGWHADRRLTDSVASDCVVGNLGPGGKPTLMLSARSVQNQPIPSGYAGAAMRVSSPSLNVPLGSMVYIQGLLRIDSPPGESQSGLLVSDSAGGESLGQLISANDPSTYEWRRFELVRFVTKPGGIRIHFETRGKVQALISDLGMEMIVPTPQTEIATAGDANSNSFEFPLQPGLPVNASPLQGTSTIRQPYTTDQ